MLVDDLTESHIDCILQWTMSRLLEKNLNKSAVNKAGPEQKVSKPATNRRMICTTCSIAERSFYYTTLSSEQNSQSYKSSNEEIIIHLPVPFNKYSDF